jgi:hypothetical protein
MRVACQSQCAVASLWRAYADPDSSSTIVGMTPLVATTTLLDGLNYYKTCTPSDWQRTLKVEQRAANIVKLIAQHGAQPTALALREVYELLLDIEQWKAMCLQQRMGNAGQNSELAVWNAFRGALTAQNDRDAILSVMQLKGFGSSRDDETGQRRAKVATSAMRFLRPDTWGVVDWRTAAMLSFLDQSKDDVDQALLLAKKWKANDLRDAYDVIDENAACAYNQMYRDRRAALNFPRTVDVEMALFGLSMMAWPFR